MTRREPIWMLPADRIDRLAIEQLVADGAEESVRLDFKQEPYPLTDGGRNELRRDVAAMLTSGGGLIVVGVAEDGHRAGALTPLSDPMTVAEWVERIVFSGVEPKPLAFRAVGVETSEKSGYVAIVARGGRGRPFAAQVNGRCEFWVRHGRSKSEMSWREVRDAFRRADDADKDLAADWGAALGRVSERYVLQGPVLIASITPVNGEESGLDLAEPALRAVLAEPPDQVRSDFMLASEILSDRHVVTPSSFGLRVVQRDEEWVIEVQRNGRITIAVRQDRLLVHVPEIPLGGAFDSRALVLYPVNLTRLARRVYADQGVLGPYVCSLALFGASRRSLTDVDPHRIGGFPGLRGAKWRTADTAQVNIVAAATEVLGTAPEPFFQPLVRLYNAFGFERPPTHFFDESGAFTEGVGR